jgi:hypothetical protein
MAPATAPVKKVATAAAAKTINLFVTWLKGTCTCLLLFLSLAQAGFAGVP